MKDNFLLRDFEITLCHILPLRSLFYIDLIPNTAEIRLSVRHPICNIKSPVNNFCSRIQTHNEWQWDKFKHIVRCNDQSHSQQVRKPCHLQMLLEIRLLRYTTFTWSDRNNDVYRNENATRFHELIAKLSLSSNSNLVGGLRWLHYSIDINPRRVVHHSF